MIHDHRNQSPWPRKRVLWVIVLLFVMALASWSDGRGGQDASQSKLSYDVHDPAIPARAAQVVKFIESLGFRAEKWGSPYTWEWHPVASKPGTYEFMGGHFKATPLTPQPGKVSSLNIYVLAAIEHPETETDEFDYSGNYADRGYGFGSDIFDDEFKKFIPVEGHKNGIWVGSRNNGKVGSIKCLSVCITAFGPRELNFYDRYRPSPRNDELRRQIVEFLDFVPGYLLGIQAKLCEAGLCRCGPPPAQPTEKKDPCAKERNTLIEASLKANFAAYHLQTVREAIAELDQEWEKRRESAFWSGAIDVAMLAGSIWAKPTAALFGVKVAEQQLVAQLVEAAAKGVVKDGLKRFSNYCESKESTPAMVLAALEKGAENAGKKILEDFTTEYLTLHIMDDFAAGENAILPRMQIALGGVDKTMLGGTEVSAFVRKEYAGPLASLAGVLVTLGSAMDGAWTAHSKLEALRIAIKALREQEIARSRAWDMLRQEFDLARSNFNYCRKLHPESPELVIGAPSVGSESGAQRAPVRRTVEDNQPPRTGQPPAPATANIVLPYDSAEIGMRNGQLVATVVQKASYYEQQGLVVGSRLASIDMVSIAGRSLEEVKRLLNQSDSGMVVLEFVRPDGQSVHIPIPVRK